MSLPTPIQSVSKKWLHQCVNHKKKLSLRNFLPTFSSYSFFQASVWLGVDKVIQKLKNSYIKVNSDIYFNVASCLPENVRVKPHFNTQCPPPSRFSYLPTVLFILRLICEGCRHHDVISSNLTKIIWQKGSKSIIFSDFDLYLFM